MNKIIYCVLFIAIFSAASVVAVSRKPPLQIGMSRSDVISQWGAPVEKSELEIKRMELWSYPEGSVVFQSGKLVSFPSAQQEQRPETPALEAKIKAKPMVHQGNQEAGMREILKEVQDKYGSGSESPGAGFPPGMNPSNSPMMMPPQPGLIRPLTQPQDINGDMVQ